MNEKQLPCICDAAVVRDPLAWLKAHGITNVDIARVERKETHELSDDIEFLVTRSDGKQAVLLMSPTPEPGFEPRHSFALLGHGVDPSLEFLIELANALSVGSVQA
jgi:hypothetical protein